MRRAIAFSALLGTLVVAVRGEDDDATLDISAPPLHHPQPKSRHPAPLHDSEHDMPPLDLGGDGDENDDRHVVEAEGTETHRHRGISPEDRARHEAEHQQRLREHEESHNKLRGEIEAEIEEARKNFAINHAKHMERVHTEHAVQAERLRAISRSQSQEHAVRLSEALDRHRDAMYEPHGDGHADHVQASVQRLHEEIRRHSEEHRDRIRSEVAAVHAQMRSSSHPSAASASPSYSAAELPAPSDE
jgi:hypothetical protein